jgi:fatty-acyl-CoA synthase
MNIADWIEKWARAKPGKAAILFEGGEMTYPRFNDEIKAAARLLKSQLDIAPGDRVAYLGQNHPQLLVFLFACARLGAILVPLNWRLAPREHVGMLRNCGAKAFFIDEPYRQQCASLDAELPGCRFVAMAQGGDDGRWPRLAELSRRADGVDRHEGIGLDSPLLIIYTSGTTGSPKGAVLTQEAVQYNAFNSALLHDMTSQDLILSLLPLFHVGGLNVQTTTALYVGATVILHRLFELAWCSMPSSSRSRP